MILKLGEAGAVDLLLSSQVLAEIENVVRKKAPRLLGALSLLLDRSNIVVVPQPDEATIKKIRILVGYPADALVIAAAWRSKIDYLVTLDRFHILDNQPLRLAAPFPIGTPGDFLLWFRNKY